MANTAVWLLIHQQNMRNLSNPNRYRVLLPHPRKNEDEEEEEREPSDIGRKLLIGTLFTANFALIGYLIYMVIKLSRLV